MPIIKVIKPFGLRLDSGRERQDFGVGEHFLSDEEFRHWFVQACLKEGRAQIVVEFVPDPEGDTDPEEEAAADPEGDTDPEEEVELVSPTREELMNLTVPKLREIANSCGATLPSNANKAAIVDILLAGREGVTLVKSPDGSWVEKAE